MMRHVGGLIGKALRGRRQKISPHRKKDISSLSITRLQTSNTVHFARRDDQSVEPLDESTGLSDT